MKNNATTIRLVTSDEETASLLLKVCLELHCKVVTTGADADTVKQACNAYWDLLIIHTKHQHSFTPDACKKIKTALPLRQIFIISEDTDPEYISHCMHEGADDYIIIPWNSVELKARISNATRRHQLIAQLVDSHHHDKRSQTDSANPSIETQQPADTEECPYLHVGDVRLCPFKREVVIDGEALHLTRTEYQLLTYLSERIDRPCSSVELLNNVLGYKDENYLPSLHSHVSRLRRKINHSNVTSIETIWCYGYRISANHP